MKSRLLRWENKYKNEKVKRKDLKRRPQQLPNNEKDSLSVTLSQVDNLRRRSVIENKNEAGHQQCEAYIALDRLTTKLTSPWTRLLNIENNGWDRIRFFWSQKFQTKCNIVFTHICFNKPMKMRRKHRFLVRFHTRILMTK